MDQGGAPQHPVMALMSSKFACAMASRLRRGVPDCLSRKTGFSYNPLCDRMNVPGVAASGPKVSTLSEASRNDPREASHVALGQSQLVRVMLPVRNFRGGDGNVGIIPSPVRAIALLDRSGPMKGMPGFSGAKGQDRLRGPSGRCGFWRGSAPERRQIPLRLCPG